jgi:hypothetical protein
MPCFYLFYRLFGILQIFPYKLNRSNLAKGCYIWDLMEARHMENQNDRHKSRLAEGCFPVNTHQKYISKYIDYYKLGSMEF